MLLFDLKNVGALINVDMTEMYTHAVSFKGPFEGINC